MLEGQNVTNACSSLRAVELSRSFCASLGRISSVVVILTCTVARFGYITMFVDVIVACGQVRWISRNHRLITLGTLRLYARVWEEWLGGKDVMVAQL